MGELGNGSKVVLVNMGLLSMGQNGLEWVRVWNDPQNVYGLWVIYLVINYFIFTF